MSTLVIEEIEGVSLDAGLPCQAVLRYFPERPCGNQAVARISYACSASPCSARNNTAFVCQRCLDFVLAGTAAVDCPQHGWTSPLLRGII